MPKIKPLRKRIGGFTLIELIVVVAIIGVIGSIVLASLSESRQNSRNAARVVQIKEYQKAFNLYYSGTGFYPRYGANASAPVCLGDYPDNRCWRESSPLFERTSIEAAIVPQFMGQIPRAETTMFGQGSTDLYEGMVYTHQNFGKSYTINYFMEGNDKSCLIDGATGTNVGDDTLCTLVVSS